MYHSTVVHGGGVHDRPCRYFNPLAALSREQGSRGVGQSLSSVGGWGDRVVGAGTSQLKQAWEKKP